MVCWAWSITAAMDPRNLSRWDKRITDPLDYLLGEGYTITAYEETRQAYMEEIVGVGC